MSSSGSTGAALLDASGKDISASIPEEDQVFYSFLYEEPKKGEKFEDYKQELRQIDARQILTITATYYREKNPIFQQIQNQYLLALIKSIGGSFDEAIAHCRYGLWCAENHPEKRRFQLPLHIMIHNSLDNKKQAQSLGYIKEDSPSYSSLAPAMESQSILQEVIIKEGEEKIFEPLEPSTTDSRFSLQEMQNREFGHGESNFAQRNYVLALLHFRCALWYANQQKHDLEANKAKLSIRKVLDAIKKQEQIQEQKAEEKKAEAERRKKEKENNQNAFQKSLSEGMSSLNNDDLEAALEKFKSLVNLTGVDTLEKYKAEKAIEIITNLKEIESTDKEKAHDYCYKALDAIDSLQNQGIDLQQLKAKKTQEFKLIKQQLAEAYVSSRPEHARSLAEQAQKLEPQTSKESKSEEPHSATSEATPVKSENFDYKEFFQRADFYFYKNEGDACKTSKLKNAENAYSMALMKITKKCEDQRTIIINSLNEIAKSYLEEALRYLSLDNIEASRQYLKYARELRDRYRVIEIDMTKDAEEYGPSEITLDSEKEKIISRAHEAYKTKENADQALQDIIEQANQLFSQTKKSAETQSEEKILVSLRKINADYQTALLIFKEYPAIKKSIQDQRRIVFEYYLKMADFTLNSEAITSASLEKIKAHFTDKSFDNLELESKEKPQDIFNARRDIIDLCLVATEVDKSNSTASPEGNETKDEHDDDNSVEFENYKNAWTVCKAIKSLGKLTTILKNKLLELTNIHLKHAEKILTTDPDKAKKLLDKARDNYLFLNEDNEEAAVLDEKIEILQLINKAKVDFKQNIDNAKNALLRAAKAIQRKEFKDLQPTLDKAFKDLLSQYDTNLRSGIGEKEVNLDNLISETTLKQIELTWKPAESIVIKKLRNTLRTFLQVNQLIEQAKRGTMHESLLDQAQEDLRKALTLLQGLNYVSFIVKKIHALQKDIAKKLVEKSKEYIKAGNLKNAKVFLVKAKEIYQDSNAGKEEAKSEDEELHKAEKLLEAHESICRGDDCFIRKNDEDALQAYENALSIIIEYQFDLKEKELKDAKERIIRNLEKIIKRFLRQAKELDNAKKHSAASDICKKVIAIIQKNKLDTSENFAQLRQEASSKLDLTKINTNILLRLIKNEVVDKETKTVDDKFVNELLNRCASMIAEEKSNAIAESGLLFDLFSRNCSKTVFFIFCKIEKICHARSITFPILSHLWIFSHDRGLNPENVKLKTIESELARLDSKGKKDTANPEIYREAMAIIFFPLLEPDFKKNLQAAIEQNRLHKIEVTPQTLIEIHIHSICEWAEKNPACHFMLNGLPEKERFFGSNPKNVNHIWIYEFTGISKFLKEKLEPIGASLFPIKPVVPIPATSTPPSVRLPTIPTTLTTGPNKMVPIPRSAPPGYASQMTATPISSYSTLPAHSPGMAYIPTVTTMPMPPAVFAQSAVCGPPTMAASGAAPATDVRVAQLEQTVQQLQLALQQQQYGQVYGYSQPVYQAPVYTQPSYPAAVYSQPAFPIAGYSQHYYPQPVYAGYTASPAATPSTPHVSVPSGSPLPDTSAYYHQRFGRGYPTPHHGSASGPGFGSPTYNPQ